MHDAAPVFRINGYIARGDGAQLVARKLLKRALATGLSVRTIEAAVGAAQRHQLPDAWLFRAYRLLIGLYIFRGIREEMREARR